MVAKLGNFLVDIDTKVDEKGINSLNKSLGGLATKGAKVGSVLLGATTLAGGGFIKIVKNTVEGAAELGRLADDLGVSTNFLETFIRSFETVGGGAGEAIDTIRSLKKEVEGMRSLGIGKFKEFGILGINLGSDFSKNFDVIRKKFRGLSDAQRLLFIDQIGLGEKTLRVLRLSDDEYAKIQRRSKEISTLTKEQNKEAEKFARQIKLAEQSYSSFKRDLILEISPAFTEFSKEMTKLFNDPSFRENIKSSIEGLLQVLPKLVAILPDLVNALVKLANFVAPERPDDNVNEAYNKSSFFARAASKAGYYLTGGGLLSMFEGGGFNDVLSGLTKREVTDKGVVTTNIDEEGQRRIDRRGTTGFSDQELVEYLKSNKGVLMPRDYTAQNQQQSNNTYNINMPIQRLGDDITQEDRILMKMEDALDRREQNNNRVASENFKSGAIQ